MERKRNPGRDYDKARGRGYTGARVQGDSVNRDASLYPVSWPLFLPLSRKSSA